jgi:2-polyprenyl-6-methoxyphenol hydroxylase-like FAD-dependent oxidoreductase
MPLNILIVGAGVCGPAFALLLQKSNPKHTITVIERFPSLRTGGQQIDLKQQGIPIMKKMGLLETIRSHCVKESGMELVDKNGKSLMKFGVTAAGAKQGFELTNEFEFMRGDMVKVFYDATVQERARAEANGETQGGLTYQFGKTITALDQSSDAGVTVTFSDNETKHYDLVVAADGQASRTRRLAFGEETSAASFKSLGIHAAYYNIPRLEREDSLARIFFASDSRMIITRTGDRPKTQVYFFLMKDKQRAARLRDVHKQPIAEQKVAWTDLYKTAGWECERFVDGLQTVEDFYACEIGQVKMPNQQLHSNRVVLLGDAGYCPSAFTGMGTTLSLIGAYVLAGELARHPNDLKAALKSYEQKMVQPIEECQNLPPGSQGGIFPTSDFGVKLVNNVIWTMSCFKIDKLIRWISGLLPDSQKGGWEVPEYKELNLVEDTAS